MKIGIYIYDQAEVLDFAGPYEVFSTAARLTSLRSKPQVFLVGETGRMVTARAGFCVQPHYGFNDCPALDVLIVVGGVHKAEMAKPQVLSWLSERAMGVDMVASVCTGVFLLAQAGIVQRGPVTTHWQDVEELRHDFPHLEVVDHHPWVDQGRLLTSAGIAAGIDMSLHVVQRLLGLDLALAVAKQMEYAWNEASHLQSQNATEVDGLRQGGPTHHNPLYGHVK